MYNFFEKLKVVQILTSEDEHLGREFNLQYYTEALLTNYWSNF